MESEAIPTRWGYASVFIEPLPVVKITSGRVLLLRCDDAHRRRQHCGSEPNYRGFAVGECLLCPGLHGYAPILIELLGTLVRAQVGDDDSAFRRNGTDTQAFTTAHSRTTECPNVKWRDRSFNSIDRRSCAAPKATHRGAECSTLIL